ncbi:MAG: DUF721 domain-containing protein [Planctomycetes bacterium]|nr:DUF721 domain-containing protein [Planctomycetota bacterium]
MIRRDEGQPKGAQPIGEIVDALLRKTEAEALVPTQRVAAAWKRIVARDHKITRTRLANFRRGVAVVEVVSPPLCAELAQFRRDQLLASLRQELEDNPPVRELRFRLGAF